MTNRSHSLSLNRQCQLLALNRSSVYYRPKEISAKELQLMHLIDQIHMNYPFFGSRRIRDELEAQGLRVNRKHIQRLMRLMRIQAIYPKKKTSLPAKEYKVYPYLLRDLEIKYSNQVWAADITYIPMPRGFLYLVAIMDWHSRKVLAWRLSNSMDSSFCVEALKQAICEYGTPEIFNTDQGAQFTSQGFTDLLEANNIAISMDGKGRWLDNVFVERLWRSLKYEEVYLKAYENVPEAKLAIATWFEFYNSRRRHQALNRKTPDIVYSDGLRWSKVA